MDTGTERLADIVAASAASAGLKATYVGSAISIAGGWLVSSQGLAFLGVCIGLAGYITQLVLGMRRDRREEREHQARMRGMQ